MESLMKRVAEMDRTKPRLVSYPAVKALFVMSCIFLFKIQLEWHHGYITRLLF